MLTKYSVLIKFLDEYTHRSLKYSISYVLQLLEVYKTPFAEDELFEVHDESGKYQLVSIQAFFIFDLISSSVRHSFLNWFNTFRHCCVVFELLFVELFELGK
jgi:hypothetical protein